MRTIVPGDDSVQCARASPREAPPRRAGRRRPSGRRGSRSSAVAPVEPDTDRAVRDVIETTRDYRQAWSVSSAST